jgi:hypothetical protein
MKYKKGLIINNTCYVCNNPKMKIYRVKRHKVEGITHVFIWCECENCGAVDDLIREEN